MRVYEISLMAILSDGLSQWLRPSQGSCPYPRLYSFFFIWSSGCGRRTEAELTVVLDEMTKDAIWACPQVLSAWQATNLQSCSCP